MRANYVLLAVAALLSVCGATATTTTSVKVVETNRNELLGNSKRALRLHGSTRGTETTWADSEDEGHEDVKDDEERMFSVSNVLGLKKASEKAPVVEKALEKVVSLEKKAPIANLFVFDDLNKMTRDLDFKIDRWKDWYRGKYTLGEIRVEIVKYDLDLNPKFKGLLIDYINLFKSRVDELDDAAVETAKKAGKKVHFGTITETTIDKIDAVMAEKAAIVAKKLQAEKLLRKQQKKWWQLK